MATDKALAKVQNWLFERQGQCFCDDCIAREVGLERTSISRSLLGGGFSRYKGRCVKCSSVARVTIARRLVWA
jgi:hypothetical protein